jgi:hypothetical protein
MNERKPTMTVSPPKRHIPLSTVRPKRSETYRHDIAAQVIAAGDQDVNVLAVAACNSGNGIGYIAVRVGRILIYVHDRDSLNSFRDAWKRAEALADNAFGPLFATPQSETAARIRRDGGTPNY